jgi:2-oxoglutarate ferredoxin oxidoreductase subunit delta
MATATERRVIGTVVISAERCKGCGFCVEFCPPDAMMLSEQYNAKGYHPPMLSSPEKCTGCNICGLLCPDFAIYGFVIKKKTERRAS